MTYCPCRKCKRTFCQLTVFKPMLLRCILVLSSKRSSVAESRAHTNLSGDFLTCMTSFYEHTHSASNRPLCRAQHSSSSSRFFSHCPPHFTRLVSGFFLQQRTVLLQSAVKNENVMQWWLKRLFFPGGFTICNDFCGHFFLVTETWTFGARW